MRLSKYLLPTLREVPAEAEIVSHQLMLRAGLMRKLASGVYSYLPMGLKTLRKVENILREEMNREDAVELIMSALLPAESYMASGRWEIFGSEMFRLKDRSNRDFCLGPTHEEIITSVARDILKSYKQLPTNLYQIQSKFRDEVRPRFGLLRGREFIMKDAYSFGTSQEELDKEYENMAQAYRNIFKRCGLDTKMVQSDSGAIGGSVSHEFMVITDTDAGENDVFYCDDCDYSANSNHAVSKLPPAVVDGKEYFAKNEVIDTPNAHSIIELSELLKIPSTLILKSLVYIVDKKPVIALIRADKTIEETKLMNAVGGMDIRIASSAEIEELMQQHGFNAIPGFIGPKGFNDVTIIADNTVKEMKNFVVGINKTDVHQVGANLEDLGLDEIKYADLRLVEAGEFCPECGKPLKVTRGIEVGNIFQLGTKYSKPMNAVYLDSDGKTKPYIMGCYGIGITRTAAAAVEAHHDEHGIKWPLAIAPYHVTVVPVSVKDELQMQTAQRIYDELLKNGVEAVIDDREERPGVKFKDADLIGFPYRITVGKTINEGNVEFVTRQTGEKEVVKPEEAIKRVIDAVKAL